MNAGEKADGEALSRQYAALCDVFVMDAFGTAHRAQASTHGVIRFAKQAAGGPLLMAELEAQAKALDRSEEPTSELQSLMRISYALFGLTTKIKINDLMTLTLA